MSVLIKNPKTPVLETPAPATQPVTDVNGVVTYEGTMTAFDNRCYVDAQCIATVGDYTIEVSPGMVGEVILGKSDVNDDTIGKKVKVRAKKVTDNELTIVGDESYYVLVATE